MSQGSKAYLSENERLRKALSEILADEQAASWVVEQRIEKEKELLSLFHEKRLALVSFDVDKIKDFVFATSKPLEIHGASAMVVELESLVKKILEKKGLSDSNILFVGGGTGLLITPKDKGKEIADEIQNLFTYMTHTCSCTAVSHEFAPHEIIASPHGPHIPVFDRTNFPQGVTVVGKEAGKAIPFGKIFQLLADRLREAKEEKVSLAFPPISGIFHRCESCGMEVATEWDAVQPEESPDRICGTCLLKRKKGRNEREKLKRTPLQTSLSINDITAVEERGYFAVLHADANNMGRTLFNLQGMVDYALFSQAVKKVMEEVIQDLVRDHNLTGRYQSPVIGGDDILLILPAQKVAKVALDLIENIKRRFSDKANAIGGNVSEHLRRIRMSVGFVIVPAHFSIRFAVDYAESLLRSAKEKCSEKDGEGEDYIDYLVLKDASPLNLSITELRRLYFQRERPEWILKLTRKPLKLSIFKEILENIEKLKSAGVAQGQLHQIETLLLQESPKVADLNIRYQWLQVESWRQFCNSKGYLDIQEGIKKFGVLCGGPVIYESGFLDLVELYEFKEKG